MVPVNHLHLVPRGSLFFDDTVADTAKTGGTYFVLPARNSVEPVNEGTRSWKEKCLSTSDGKGHVPG